jgi:hypothetical protein
MACLISIWIFKLAKEVLGVFYSMNEQKQEEMVVEALILLVPIMCLV